MIMSRDHLGLGGLSENQAMKLIADHGSAIAGRISLDTFSQLANAGFSDECRRTAPSSPTGQVGALAKAEAVRVVPSTSLTQGIATGRGDEGQRMLSLRRRRMRSCCSSAGSCGSTSHGAGTVAAAAAAVAAATATAASAVAAPVVFLALWIVKVFLL